MATANGARAMGFNDSGVLAAAHQPISACSILDQPHLYPRHNMSPTWSIQQSPAM